MSNFNWFRNKLELWQHTHHMKPLVSGDELKQYRIDNNLTHRDVAKQLRISKGREIKYENEYFIIPDYLGERIIKIMDKGDSND